MSDSDSSGYIDFIYKGETFQTWYKSIGDLASAQPGIRPLIVLHGGPAIPNPYMDPHIELYRARGIPLVFYDQIGGGKSTHLPQKPADFWSLELFMDELDNILSHFNLTDKKFDLLGHSWGGMLAADYVASRQPKGLGRLVIAGAPASMTLWELCTNKLLDRLPKELRETLRKHEREGTTDDPEYQAGMQVFYGKHICTLDPWPEELLDAFGKMEEDITVYRTMIGPSEFNITGTLRTWTVVDKVHSIAVPTLLINGVEDEAQDECVRPFFEKIPRVKWVTFAKSSHMPFYEEPERYFSVVGEFLTTTGVQAK